MPLRRLLLVAILCLPAVAAHADALADAATAVARKDYASAVRLLEPLATSGNALAQTQFAALHYHGQGVREDNAIAAQWYERAARQGHAPAQFLLANMYAYGEAPVAEGHDAMRLAAQWYFEAARRNHADAQYALGVLFLAGSGVTPSQKEARKWFARAARNGHADARAYLRDSPR